MVSIEKDALVFTFPEVHPGAALKIAFLRVLRLPDNGQIYQFPHNYTRFPIVHVDDFKDQLDPLWIEHGGVMLPMYQGDAMRIQMESKPIPGRRMPFPFAVKIGCGKINAVTGEPFDDDIKCGENQNYISVREYSRTLKGYCAADSYVRQFTAVPLGSGLSAEELITGKALYGGIQIKVYPMLREAYDAYYPETVSAPVSVKKGPSVLFQTGPDHGMGLAPGDSLKQKLQIDSCVPDDWDTANTARCFVHILNSQSWNNVTGNTMPMEKPRQDFYREEQA